MRHGIAIAVCVAAGPARADQRDVDLRLTLSTFLFRETGADAPAVVEQGAALPNASPVRRYFGDLRGELAAGGLALDARVRQTTSERYQAGAAGGGEYEIRTLAYRLGSQTTSLTVGRQAIAAVGATRIDGIAVTRALSRAVSATAFGGALPQRGSRSLDTDYLRARRADGSETGHVVPLTGGLGVAYRTPELHGDVGAAAVHVAQDVPGATAAERSRVFTTASGYWRIAAPLGLYHFALLDVAGAGGAQLTNGSVGIDARPLASVQLTASLHHVSTDLLEITARDVLVDPDPAMAGVVQNNVAIARVSQDAARTAVSVALAEQRFEISASGALRRRPAVTVPLGDGGFAFPEARSADAGFAILDRRSLAGLRAQLSATLSVPLGSGQGSRARGTVVRLSAGRTFAQDRGQVEVDAMAERFRDAGSTGPCMTSLDALACFGTSTTIAAQAGALASWRIGREWLVLADAHAGYRDVASSAAAGSIAWPKVYSITSFLRVQWRVR